MQGHRQITQILVSIVFVMTLVIPSVPAIEFVYMRSGPFGQLITSNTLHWTKAKQAKDPVQVPSMSSEEGSLKLCMSTGPKNIGLLYGDHCRVVRNDGTEDDTTSYQLLSGHASKIKWTAWTRPRPPPPGSVALLHNRDHFIAYDPETGSVGFLEYSKTSIGLCLFPTGNKNQGLILTEVEPMRYQMTDIELKQGKGFSEEPVILATKTIRYIPPEENEYERSRSETIVTYTLTNQYDYWGQGILMAKGLPTTIRFPGKSGVDHFNQVIEWGLPSVQSEKAVTVPVWADLSPGTGINVTIRGTRLKGDMTFWAALKTFYKDGTHKTRHVEGQRKVDKVEGIVVDQSKPFYLRDGSPVTEPTTTTTTTGQPLQTTEPLQGEQELEDSSQNMMMTSPNISPETEYTENLQLNSVASKASSILRCPQFLILISSIVAALSARSLW